MGGGRGHVGWKKRAYLFAYLDDAQGNSSTKMILKGEFDEYWFVSLFKHNRVL